MKNSLRISATEFPVKSVQVQGSHRDHKSVALVSAKSNVDAYLDRVLRAAAIFRPFLTRIFTKIVKSCVQTRFQEL